MWRCLWVLKNFPVILLENDGGNGGGGGVEVPVREDITVERSVFKWKEEKKGTNERYGQTWKGEMDWNEWWVVGLGGACGNFKKNLTLHIFFF